MCLFQTNQGGANEANEGEVNQGQTAQGESAEANEGEANHEGETGQGESAEGQTAHGQIAQGQTAEMGTNEGIDDVAEGDEGGQHFPNEFYPGGSQPTTEIDDSQGGIFMAPTAPPNPGPSGVTPKSWQKKNQTVTTRETLLRARSSREKKINRKYVD